LLFGLSSACCGSDIERDITRSIRNRDFSIIAPLECVEYSFPTEPPLVLVADLTVFRYHNGPFDPQNWAVPLRAVGWLEHPYPFSRGNVAAAVVSKLKAMVEQTRSTYTQYTFRGTKSCSLCIAANLPDPGPIWSQENILVPGAGVVYVAPGGIVHYVESHSYLPPDEFVEAVLDAPTVD
jgi:hypothetical protein